MSGIKEIRTKIKSVQSTKKITRAMEMVAASKMRKAQERMQSSRPYADKVRKIAFHLMQSDPEYSHPYLIKRDMKAVGIILISTDKGLCGGLNTNVSRIILSKIKEFSSRGISVQTTAFGAKGLSLLTRIDSNLVSQEINLGDIPDLDKLLGSIKVQLDDYKNGKIDALYVVMNKFINTMVQEPVFLKLLPLPSNLEDPYQIGINNLDSGYKLENKYNWDYIYEPSKKDVINDLLQRYVEGLLYQAVAENMASEHSARMVAMKAASDNAQKVISELQMIYNKTRQSSITKEISEIVSGSAVI
ncbi:ATP synthase gamma chain [Candidatus Kinetoplastibacterium sorsogonicusi]|uniref:ATP synthase gamma chain n=1 Tax=Candidatus Kinetoplastidibacterium kentomonadis TaxID=1576550 RepID=A0A3Q8ETE2_9PROT|nr:F0F1 ATP synthase subunit gamma [Candidatus Kinetoplastibacterium sorsogonicusi]AWD32199.1 ATP synthase gamma chain [Candidatus Kinetoplastibacterium sorsogonicusi]